MDCVVTLSEDGVACQCLRFHERLMCAHIFETIRANLRYRRGVDECGEEADVNAFADAVYQYIAPTTWQGASLRVPVILVVRELAVVGARAV